MKAIIILFTITLTTIITSCNRQKTIEHEERHEEHGDGVVMLNENQRDALNLKLGSLEMRNLTSAVKTNGELEIAPGNIAEVSTFIGGNVKEIKVFNGDKVDKGQTLVILEHPDYITLQEEFAEIANKLEFLEIAYSRQKELFENQLASGKDYQQTRAEYNTTKARFDGLKSRLEMLNLNPDNVSEGQIYREIPVKSPISGHVVNVDISVGSFADAQKIMFKIIDNREIYANFMVYEKDIHLLKTGQEIIFTAANRPGEELTATIFSIGKEFEPDSRAVHVYAKLTRNPGNLVPGMYISGHIQTDQNYAQTLPLDAIVNEGIKSYIFIKDNRIEEAAHEEHKEEKETWAFRMTEVITGRQDGAYIEVILTDSTQANPQVVLNAAYYLLSDLKKGETEHEH